MKNIKLVQTYSKILFAKAVEAKLQDKVASDLENISAILEESQKSTRFLSAPIYSDKEKKDLLDVLLKKLKLQKLTQNFLDVALQNNRIKDLPSICDDFIKRLLALRGENTATLISARKMSEKDLKSCIAMFEKQLGKKFIVSHKIDPTIIGGVILNFGGQMLDLSILNIQNKLSREINEV